jgi:hypothetical protein
MYTIIRFIIHYWSAVCCLIEKLPLVVLWACFCHVLTALWVICVCFVSQHAVPCMTVSHPSQVNSPVQRAGWQHITSEHFCVCEVCRVMTPYVLAGGYQQLVGVYCCQLQGRSEPAWERDWLNGNGEGPSQKIGSSHAWRRGDGAPGVAREPWALNGTTVPECGALNL